MASAYLFVSFAAFFCVSVLLWPGSFDCRLLNRDDAAYRRGLFPDGTERSADLEVVTGNSQGKRRVRRSEAEEDVETTLTIRFQVGRRLWQQALVSP